MSLHTWLTAYSVSFVKINTEKNNAKVSRIDIDIDIGADIEINIKSYI